MIRAVIFDMDGLLLDSEIYWEEARRNYCRDQGCDWTPDDELSVKGNNSPEWAAAIRQRCELDIDTSTVIEAVTSSMRSLYHQHLPLLPGATEIVRELSREYPLAIASSSPAALIQFAMSEAGLEGCFQIVVSADQVARGKPAPDVFLLAAEQLGHPPRYCAVFEDSSAGITAAHSAGMFVVAVPNPHYPANDDALRRADLKLSSLEQFDSAMFQAA